MSLVCKQDEHSHNIKAPFQQGKGADIMKEKDGAEATHPAYWREPTNRSENTDINM